MLLDERMEVSYKKEGRNYQVEGSLNGIIEKRLKPKSEVSAKVEYFPSGSSHEWDLFSLL